MKKNFWIFIYIFLVFLLAGCKPPVVSEEERDLIYTKKGFDDMKKERLKPELYKCKEGLVSLVEINTPNTMAGLNAKGEFILVQFGPEGEITLSPIVKGVPGTVGELRSDSEHTIVWLIRGRGMYAMDIPTKAHVHRILGLYGKVITSIVISAEKKILGASTLSAGAEGYGYHIVDIKDPEAYQECGLSNSIYPYYDDFVLFPNYPDKKKSYHTEWATFRYDIMNKRVVKYNKLTDELTKYQMRCNKNSKAFHLGKRIMLGTNWLRSPSGKKLVYYSIRWDKEMEEVSIEPLTIQLPENTSVSTEFSFSGDGNWVKTSLKYKNSLIKRSELIIYHVNSAYPQHLSLPLYCGFVGGYGGFMNHDQWGPCYVELSWDKPDILNVYKLRDGLEIIRKQMMNIH